jgi:26S proteasome regulatory subunit N5
LLFWQEDEGDVSTAADYLQDVQVETYGSLSKKEKVEYILEQLRLTLAKKDYVRAAIVSGKINRKHLAEMADYKVRFFTLLAILHRHEKDALELVKDYHAIYLTLQEKEQEDTAEELDQEGKWQDALQATVVFLALAPYGNEQQDIMNKVNVDPNLEKLPLCQYVLLLVPLVLV